MVTTGSDQDAPAAPALVAVVAVLLGVGLMILSQRFLAYSLGLRPTLIVSEVLLAAPALLAALLLGVPAAAGLGLRRVGRRTVLLAFAAGATLWATSLGLFELQYVVWRPDPAYLEMFRRLHAALRPHDALDAVYSVLAIAVGPAVCEELLVRGVVLPSFSGPLGAGGAIAASAVVFALIHLDPYRAAFTLVAGIALALLRVRSGSLLPPVLAHTTLNTITLVAAALLDDPAQGMPEPQPFAGAGALLGGALATAFVLSRFRAPGAAPRAHR